MSPDKLFVIASAAVIGLFCLAYQLGRLRQTIERKNRRSRLALEVTRADRRDIQETRSGQC